MEQEISQLEARVAELNLFFDSREKERLTYPLDAVSRETVKKSAVNLMVATGNTPSDGAVGLLSDYLQFGLVIYINNQKRIVYASLPLRAFTANAGNDTITNTSGSHNLKNGDTIAVVSTDTLPAGLLQSTLYYVINQSGATFKVSTSLGGSAVDITDAGIGTHYFAAGIS